VAGRGFGDRPARSRDTRPAVVLVSPCCACRPLPPVEIDARRPRNLRPTAHLGKWGPAVRQSPSRRGWGVGDQRPPGGPRLRGSL
jgi:hypothetical protein